MTRWTGVCNGGEQQDEETHARLIATKATLHQIDAVADEEWARKGTIDRMRGLYEFRRRRLAARAGKIEDDGFADRSRVYQQVVRSVLAAQRELDLEESRLET